MFEKNKGLYCIFIAIHLECFSIRIVKLEILLCVLSRLHKYLLIFYFEKIIFPEIYYFISRTAKNNP